ncbi:MAG: transferrin receptor-like dimerization domain-containing protein [Balneolaceae bacterium]|jgi:N-acetylated-alpha-linked acidic dipeptidase
MKQIYVAVASLIFLFTMLAAVPLDLAEGTLAGFTKAHGIQQKKLEAQFDSYLSADHLRDRMKRMSAEPNHLGSPYDKENAEYLNELFTSWGFDSQIEEFKVLFPTPKERLLEMTVPNHYKASLQEPTLKQDATSSIRKNSLPPYNAYAADGDVTAELVYVNQGVPDDYKELEKRGISVKGKIVIARYGGSWRGIKPKVAYEHGAIGCILYSDPKDDGYGVGDTYPKGSWRPQKGVQRGSVMDMPIHPGDPLTPGVGATEDAKRLSRKDAKVILNIPVLPISYADAQPLLEAIEGPVAPPSWRGGLPITYHIGSGPAKVHLKVSFNWDMVSLYDVIAKIEGSEYPDQWVIRGNHMDGWVFGAADPLSGNVAMTEEAYAIGQLAKTGWKPKRTIVYCSWDGEEPGLLGSTEWAEKHAEELQQKAVVYINSDGNSRGFLYAGGSHSLQHFINETGHSVPDPETNVDVIARARARQMVNGNKELSDGRDLPIYPLGSGSDYTPFLQHLGIASLNLGFWGEGEGGVYHSRYDSFDHYIRFADPDFQYGVALSKTAGHAVLRFANADILPYHFSDMAHHVGDYLAEIQELTKSMREQTAFNHKLLADSSYTLASDPTKTFNPPKKEAAVPFLNFAPLENAVAHVKESASAYDEAFNTQMNEGITISDNNLKELNELLQSSEQELTSKQGLPRRPWFRHQVYAPGFYTGYGVKTLPGVREAIEQRNWDEAAREIKITANAVDRYARHIDEATDLIK